MKNIKPIVKNYLMNVHVYLNQHMIEKWMASNIELVLLVVSRLIMNKQHEYLKLSSSSNLDQKLSLLLSLSSSRSCWMRTHTSLSLSMFRSNTDLYLNTNPICVLSTRSLSPQDVFFVVFNSVIKNPPGSRS